VSDSSPAPGQRSPAIDTTVPHSARIWNYWLGSSDNFPVDREAGDQYLEVFPDILEVARASRHDQARSIVRRLLAALPSGSYLTLNDGTNVVNPAGEQAQQDYNESGAIPYKLRSPEQLAAFFEGLELVEPGVVSCPRWRPDPADPRDGSPAEVDAFGGVGRKP
jgi:S-adenosyl methyltransferase